MRLCFDTSAMPLEKQGLEPGPGPGPGGPAGAAALTGSLTGALSGLHAALAPLGSLAPLGTLGPLGPLGALARTADGVLPVPSPATLNLSLNLPLPFHMPQTSMPSYLKDLFLASLIRGIYQPAGPLISTAGAPSGATLLAPKSGASSGGRGSPPANQDPAPPAPENEAAAEDGDRADQDGAAPASPSTSTPAGSMPPPSHAPPHAFRYAAHGAHGAYHPPPQPYYSPYPQQYYPGQYQDPCYPNYYHRALHYRRHYTSYLAPAPGPPPGAGPPPGPDPYVAPGASALAAPNVGAAPLGHQLQMVVSSGAPAGPGAPPPGHGHAAGPEFSHPEPYGHYPAYPPPGPETATFRCPCPMQSCPKNVHTGPLTGDGKGPKQMQPLALSLPPVSVALPSARPALPHAALPHEALPQGFCPPSPARGSAGMPPPPSPAVGAAHQGRFQGWDHDEIGMEGSKSVVKPDPGTPPEGPREPPALVLATRHNLIRQNVPPHEQPGPDMPVTIELLVNKVREGVKVEGDKLEKDDQAAHADAEDKKDVKSVAVAFITTTVTTTTIEEATQTTPPPDPSTRLGCLDGAVDKRTAAGQVAAADEPPSKKKKAVSKSKHGSSKTKKAPEPVAAAAATLALVPASTATAGPSKSKASRKSGAASSTSPSTATAVVGSPASAPAAVSPSTSADTTHKTSRKLGTAEAGGKGRAQKRTSSLDSNKSTSSSKSAKRSKSQDKPNSSSSSSSNNNNNNDTTSNNNKKAASSRDSSKNRSRSTSRSRIQEEEEEAARVIAEAALPEGVPLNQCRRLIAAQKKLILRCEAKKERERARLAKQEAARAARLAALVSAAEAKKATVPGAAAAVAAIEALGADGPAGPVADSRADQEKEKAQGPAAVDSAASRLAPPTVVIPHAGKHSHHQNHHHPHLAGDKALDRARVEELGQRAGLDIPACLTISQSELRLLESCAEPKTPKWSNGWQWRGQPFLHRVFLNCDDPPVLRKCFPAMQHEEGDNITLGDTILLKSGTRKIDLPFVARVIHLWENPEDGEMMLSLVWFYRPEHTEQGRRPCDRDDEIFSSRHKDINSVACIEDKCYVLTFNEYCRYRKTIRRLEEGLSPPSLVVPGPDGKYPRHHRLPPGHVAHDMVFFCRKIYDFRQRRLQKNIM